MILINFPVNQDKRQATVQLYDDNGLVKSLSGKFTSNELISIRDNAKMKNTRTMRIDMERTSFFLCL